MGAKMVRNAADLHFAKQRATEKGTELTTEEKALCGLHDQLAALSAPEVASPAAKAMEVVLGDIPREPNATASQQPPPPAPSDPVWGGEEREERGHGGVAED
jgi:hypothetical protein